MVLGLILALSPLIFLLNTPKSLVVLLLLIFQVAGVIRHLYECMRIVSKLFFTADKSQILMLTAILSRVIVRSNVICFLLRRGFF